VVIWELLTRKRPWDDCQTAEEIEMQVMQGHREEIPSQKDKLLESLPGLIENCWAQNPNQRPKMSSIYAQLMAFVN